MGVRAEGRAATDADGVREGARLAELDAQGQRHQEAADRRAELSALAAREGGADGEVGAAGATSEGDREGREQDDEGRGPRGAGELADRFAGREIERALVATGARRRSCTGQTIGRETGALDARERLPKVGQVRVEGPWILRLLVKRELAGGERGVEQRR